MLTVTGQRIPYEMHGRAMALNLGESGNPESKFSFREPFPEPKQC